MKVFVHSSRESEVFAIAPVETDATQLHPENAKAQESRPSEITIRHQLRWASAETPLQRHVAKAAPRTGHTAPAGHRPADGLWGSWILRSSTRLFLRFTTCRKQCMKASFPGCLLLGPSTSDRPPPSSRESNPLIEKWRVSQVERCGEWGDLPLPPPLKRALRFDEVCLHLQLLACHGTSSCRIDLGVATGAMCRGQSKRQSRAKKLVAREKTFFTSVGAAVGVNSSSGGPRTCTSCNTSKLC